MYWLLRKAARVAGMSSGLGLCLKVAIGIWTLFFVVGVIPVAMLHNWKVGTLPVVEGRLSNHEVVEVQHHRFPDVFVKATLEFDGPLKHCRHEGARIGPPKPANFARHVQIAVRTDSCDGYFLLPLNSSNWLEWAGAFLFMCFVLMFSISLAHVVWRMQRTPPTPPSRQAGPV